MSLRPVFMDYLVWRERVVAGELAVLVKKLILSAKVTLTRAAIANGIISRRSNRPIVNTSMEVMKAGAKATASISNGFALPGTDGSTILRVDCLNVRAGAVGTSTGVGVVLISSTEGLSRIIIATLNVGHSRGALNCTTDATGTSRLAITGSNSLVDNLRNGVTNIRVSNNNIANASRGIMVHNVSSISDGGPLCVISNIPVGGSHLNSGSISFNDNTNSVGPRSVRSMAMLGNTSTATLCNSHTTGNIVVVAAGGPRNSGGTSVACSNSLAFASILHIPVARGLFNRN